MALDGTDLLIAAARNNAQWCHVVCASHGIVGAFAPGTWTCPVRTPPLYPDAVTLDSSIAAGDVLQVVDASPGCTIKDSFATLDLAPAGFEVLFDATWMACASTEVRVEAESPVAWGRVTTLAQFDGWERAWRDDESETAGILLPSLLAEPLVEVLVGSQHGELVAGAIVNRAFDVIGLSNVFSRDGDDAETWSGLGKWIARMHPGRTIVGYESGADLNAAIDAGFGAVGPLRVWSRPLHRTVDSV